MNGVEKRTARLLGGYETTIYPTELGDIWHGTNRYGPVIKVLGQQECTHYLTATGARDLAAALLEIADEMDAASTTPVP